MRLPCPEVFVYVQGVAIGPGKGVEIRNRRSGRRAMNTAVLLEQDSADLVEIPHAFLLKPWDELLQCMFAFVDADNVDAIWEIPVAPLRGVGSAGEHEFDAVGFCDWRKAFTASNGSPFQISFVDSAGASAGTGTISFSISGSQTRKFVSTGAGALSIGFGTLSASGTVIGTAVFSEFTSGGVLISEASVQASAATTRQAIFVDTQSGFDTGVAYANPNSGPASITLELLNTQGVAVLPSTSQTLAGNQQTAAFVKGGLFPSSQPMAGTMQITSSVPVAAVALRFSSTGLFTTLPPVTLAGLLLPALEWLEQRPWLSPLGSLAKLLGGLQFRLG